MPRAAKVLCVQVQHGAPQIWALVGNEAETVEARPFRVFGTGQEMPGGLSYLGTFQLSGGGLVWHLFEPAR